MDVLLNSVFYGIKHAARVMIGKNPGTIINTTSTAGLRAGLGPHAYTTAKHGVVGLTQSVATELGRHGIRVNAIAPGATVSSMTAYVATGDAAALEETSKRLAPKCRCAVPASRSTSRTPRSTSPRRTRPGRMGRCSSSTAAAR